MKGEINMKSSDIYSLANSKYCILMNENGIKVPVRLTQIDHHYGEPSSFVAEEMFMTEKDQQKFLYDFLKLDNSYIEKHYINNDIATTKTLASRSVTCQVGIPGIKNVMFNYPATIVFWKDGTKTVVKCQGDEVYDPEKGLAMAIIKKLYGNKGRYFNVISEWTDKLEEPSDEPIVDLSSGLKKAKESIDKLAEALKKSKTSEV